MTERSPRTLAEVGLEARRLVDASIDEIEALQDLAAQSAAFSRLGHDLAAAAARFDVAEPLIRFRDRGKELARTLEALANDPRLALHVARQRALVFNAESGGESVGISMEHLAETTRSLQAPPLRARAIEQLQEQIRFVVQEAEAWTASREREHVAALEPVVARSRWEQERRDAPQAEPQDDVARRLDAIQQSLHRLRGMIAHRQAGSA